MRVSRAACLIALVLVVCVGATSVDAGTRNRGTVRDGFVTPDTRVLKGPERDQPPGVELPPEVICVVLPDSECLFAELRFDGMFVYGYWDPDCQGDPVIPMLGSRGGDQTSVGTEIEGDQCLVVFDKKFLVGDGLLPTSVFSAYCFDGEGVVPALEDVPYVPVPSDCDDID